MGELSDGASEDNCTIYYLRHALWNSASGGPLWGIPQGKIADWGAFLTGRYWALKSEIFILKSKISELLSFFSMLAS